MKRKDSKLTTLVVIACIMLVVFGISIGRTITNDNKNYKEALNQQLDEPLLGDTCNVTSGPTTVYEADGTYTETSNCATDFNKTGYCYQKGEAAGDTSYCGSDDSVDCYEYTRYYITCGEEKITCESGKYLAAYSSACSTCRAGYRCPGGEYIKGSSSDQGIKACTGNYYSGSGQAYCSYCSGIVNSNNTSCTEKPVITNCTELKNSLKYIGDAAVGQSSITGTWSGSNGLKIDSQGHIGPVTQAGSFNIWVTNEGVDSDACEVNISVKEDQKYVTSIKIKKGTTDVTGKTEEVAMGSTVTYAAEVSPSDATNKEVSWTAEDRSFVELRRVNGNIQITPLKTGTVKIYVSATDKQTQPATANVTLNITGNDPTSLRITCPSSNLDITSALKLSELEPTVDKETITKIDWYVKSGNAEIVEGYLNPKGTGNVVFYATANGNIKSNECKVKVVDETQITEVRVDNKTTAQTYYLALPVSSSDLAGSFIERSVSAWTTRSDGVKILTPASWNKTGNDVRRSGSTAKADVVTGSSKTQTTVTFTATGTATVNNCPVDNTFVIPAEKKGESFNSPVVNVKVYCKWTAGSKNSNDNPKNYGPFDSGQKTRDEMRFVSGCHAYERGQIIDGKLYYRWYFNRCCGSEPSTPSETKYACYANATLIENATEAEWLSAPKGNLKYPIPQVPNAESCLPYACYGNAASIADATRVLWTNVQPFGYTKYTGVARGNCVETKKTPACYGNGVTLETSNDFIWSDVTPTGYTKFEGVAEENCKKPAEETPACYRDLNGEYHWGKYYTTIGYEQMPIYDEANCKKPTEDQACYRNASGSYYWGVASEGAVKVIEVDDIDNCGEPEEEMCYLVGSEYRWGALSRITGAVPVTSIKSAALCVNDAACYKSPDGNYYWGPYANNEGFVKVDNITSPDKCTNDDVYVPQTAASVQTIVYVFMTILVVAGLVFVYYAFTQNKKSKN